MKVILLKFAKDHCFWTLWTRSCIDCIRFSCIDYFQILFSNYQKTLNLQLCSRGPIKSVLFICPSVCPSFCDAFSSGSTLWIFWIFCMRIFCHILKSDKAIICVCCLDNWVKETNLDQKWNILHFNEANITCFALNDASYWLYEKCMSWKNLLLKL